MHVLVIGGGSVSEFVVRQLVAAGHSVTLYHRGCSGLDLPPEVEHVHAPQASIPILSFPPSLFDRNVDVVIHMLLMGERDAKAAVAEFSGKTARLVVPSSGDVYRAYGRFIGLEPGPPEPTPLREESPLREKLFPYRGNGDGPEWIQDYEKILVERIVLNDFRRSSTVLRLPKVYGGGKNDNLATMYSASEHPTWRWTHGYVENVAAAIVLAASRPESAGKIYNVGEAHTPTVIERLKHLPESQIRPDRRSFNYQQDLVYDTRRIRQELGYAEIVPYPEGMRRSLERDAAQKRTQRP